MSDYRIAFPDFPASDLPLLPEGFVDRSWRNDACPCFVDVEFGLELWIDFADVNKREFPDLKRFSLCSELGAPIYESDDWADMLDAIKRARQ